MINLPDSDIPDIREYLYVDEARIRSLLAQFGQGLATEKEVTSFRSKQLQLGLKVLGSSLNDGNQESGRLALADLHVSMFEEDATALGMLADVSDVVTKSKNWKRGKLRNSLEPGMLLRVNAPTQLIDPQSIVEVFSNIDALSDEDSDFDEVAGFAKAMYGKSISLSIRPTDPPDATCSFLGMIPHTHTFSGLQRDLLFSQLGPEAPTLTSIVQIARVPTERDSGQPVLQILNDLGRQIVRADSKSLNREVLDDMLVQMMRAIEDYGMQSAPRWPAIGVVPLAIYRHVPLAPDADGSDEASD